MNVKRALQAPPPAGALRMAARSPSQRADHWAAFHPASGT